MFRGTFDDALERPQRWAESFELLRTALRAPRYERCKAMFDAFGPVVTLPPDKAGEIHAAALRFQRLRQTEPEGAQPACALTEYAQQLDPVVGRIRDLAERVSVDPDARIGGSPAVRKLRQEQALGRARHLETTLALVGMTRALGARRERETRCSKRKRPPARRLWRWRRSRRAPAMPP